MRKLLETPEIIAALITVAGTLLVNIMLSFLERRVGLEIVVAIVAALLLGLLLFLLYKRTGPRITAGAAASMLAIGLLIFLGVRLWSARAALPPTPIAAAPSTATPEMAAPSSAPHPASVSTTVESLIPTLVPPLPPGPEDTSILVQTYSLPLTEPWDVVHDGSDLWVLFEDLLVKVELVEAEGRFRIAEQVGMPTVASLTWDESRRQHWAVRGGPHWPRDEIDRIDRGGNSTATVSVPQAFVGSPQFVEWDGEYLWVTSSEGPLFKLQPSGDVELRVIDSYAPVLGRFPGRPVSGVAWDGQDLWALADDRISKLDEGARPLCTSNLPWGFPQPSWYGWRGLAWDGQFLWVTHMEANLLVRVDPNACQ